MIFYLVEMLGMINKCNEYSMVIYLDVGVVSLFSVLVLDFFFNNLLFLINVFVVCLLFLEVDLFVFGNFNLSLVVFKLSLFLWFIMFFIF